jgi:hypothetical protein
MTTQPLPPRPALSGQIIQVADLAPDTRVQMFRLMQQYYLRVAWPHFLHDLLAKQWAIVLTDSGGQVRGFSTMARFRLCVEAHPATLLFSGDTIVERDCWGDTTIHRLLGQHMMHVAAEVPAEPVYWFLICSGYKTYRMLPVFFREFYPTHQRPTPPPVRHLLDAAARQQFGSRYDAAQGVIRLEHATPLRAGVADIDARRLRDPHVAFFAAANPGHTAGDELVCLARVAQANLTAAGRRMAGRYDAGAAR